VRKNHLYMSLHNDLKIAIKWRGLRLDVFVIKDGNSFRLFNFKFGLHNSKMLLKQAKRKEYETIVAELPEGCIPKLCSKLCKDIFRKGTDRTSFDYSFIYDKLYDKIL